jgi:hypothetical protein
MVATVAFINSACAHRNFQQDGLGGIKQPVNVLLQFEHAAIVGADAFKNAVAVKQAVVEHGDFCVALVEIFAINENFHAKWLPEYFKMRVEANVNLMRGRCNASIELQSQH